MLIENRFSQILKILEQQQSVTVLELTELLNTSESTIRRDLTELHKQGLLIKVHGGAVSNGMNYMTQDAEISDRQELNREEKLSIASYCAGLIQDLDFVYLDAGSTTELIIEYLKAVQAVFVTNGLTHARKLAARGFKVYLIGGMLKSTTEAVVGTEAVESLMKYNFTKGFFGTNGVNHKSGFTTPETDEALVKKTAMAKCKEAYIVCDSSKFNQISSITFAGFNDTQIITSNLKDISYKKYENIVEVDVQ